MKYINIDVLDFNMENTPFPHVVIDNFIKPEYINSLLNDMDN